MSFKLEDLQSLGFGHFTRISELKANGCHNIPTHQGIYAVVRPCSSVPVFRDASCAGRHKGKAPSQDVDMLRQKWVSEATLLYFGKAGGGDSSSTLRSRLSEYIKSGKGYDHFHWGGRYIWQLQDCDEFLIGWMVLTDKEPRDVEKALISAFEHEYGQKPFANIQG